MYPPKFYQEKNFSNALLTIEHFPLASLITPGEEPLITHMPLIHFKEDSGYGKLLGHIDKHNDQCKLLNGKGQAIFHGPDVYISPNYYSTAQFPTWNYLKVHVKGSITITDDEKTKKSLIDMTAKLEKRANENFVLDKDHPRLLRLLDFIVGFEFKIETWEAKYKIGQDKNETDQSLVRKVLEDSCIPAHLPYFDQIYSDHFNMMKD